jgi:hypothetical protein
MYLCKKECGYLSYIDESPVCRNYVTYNKPAKLKMFNTERVEAYKACVSFSENYNDIKDKQMNENKITLKYTIDFLNSLIKIDQVGMTELFNSRVNCNKDMAYHETVQVIAKDDEFKFGILGIINGLFGVDEKTKWGHIVAIFNDYNELLEKFITKEEYDKSIEEKQKADVYLV